MCNCSSRSSRIGLLQAVLIFSAVFAFAPTLALLLGSMTPTRLTVLAGVTVLLSATAALITTNRPRQHAHTATPNSDPAALQQAAALNTTRCEPDGAARIRAILHALATIGSRSTVHNPNGMHQALTYTTGLLTDLGWTVQRVPFTHRVAITYRDVHPHWKFKMWPYTIRRNLTGTNLIASLPGTSPTTAAPAPTGFIAHLDTVNRTPGADDNGSGVAVLLELATRLSQNPPEATTVLYLVDMEEIGLIGSKALAAQIARGEHAAPAKVINLDSVGIWTDQAGSQTVPYAAGIRLWARSQMRWLAAQNWQGDFTFLGYQRRSASLAKEVTAAINTVMGNGHVLPIRDPRPAGPVGFMMKLICPALVTFDRSDHKPFWNRRVPAIVLSNTASLRVDGRYHQPGDLPDGIDCDRLNQLAQAMDIVSRQAGHAGNAQTEPVQTDGLPVRP